jgi:hypothetical protein
MDLLFKRYASPFLFMGEMIRSVRFDEFVTEFIKTTNEEHEEKASWEFYLHKVQEGSYKDFIDEMQNDKENQKMTEETKESIVQNAMNILNNFNPIEGGE